MIKTLKTTATYYSSIAVNYVLPIVINTSQMILNLRKCFVTESVLEKVIYCSQSLKDALKVNDSMKPIYDRFINKETVSKNTSNPETEIEFIDQSMNSTISGNSTTSTDCCIFE